MKNPSLALLAALSLFPHAPASAQEPVAPGSPTLRVFAKDSFWYQPIPADAPLHPQSAGFTEDFVRQIKAYYGDVTINTREFASPVYIVDKETPRVDVRFSDCQKKGYTPGDLKEQWSKVPIPAHAMPSDGTDKEMTIYDPKADKIWEFWITNKDAKGEWSACWGGRIEKASRNDGIFPNGFGTTATSLPFLGGQITIAELKALRIDHVMGIALVDTETFSILSWPATRSDGYNPQKAPNRIPEGLRFRLDPKVDVEVLQMHPAGKAIARAAQKYGFVVWDKAGSISLRAENPKSVTLAGQPDPYPAIFGATPAYKILAGFPWGRLRFLPMNYGKPRR